jgi:ligand-binding sensor domain-containing protein/signal transduction histidine kinase
MNLSDVASSGSTPERRGRWRFCEARLLKCVAGWTGVWLMATASLHALDPNKSIFQFNCQNWARLTGLPSDKISGITQTSDGYIWLGSQNGLIRFDGQDFKTVPIALPSARGQDIIMLKGGADGKIWFAINGGGYGGFDGKNFWPISDERLTGDPQSILAARDGSVWTGSVMGWGRWMAGKASQTLYDDKLGAVATAYEDPAGRVWLGTAEHGLYYWAQGKLNLFPDDDLKNKNIRAIAQDTAGDIWVGTNIGLYRYDQNFRRKEILFPASQTNALLVDRNGVLWAGFNDTGVGRYRNGNFSRLQKIDGLGSDVVTSLFEDREGSIWVGTVEGLSQLTDPKFPTFSSMDGLSHGDVISVAAAPDEGVWVATASGASHVVGNTSTNFNDPAILPNQYVRRIYAAKNGALYLADGNRNINVMTGNRLVARYPNELWPETFVEDAQGLILGIGPHLYRMVGGHPTPYIFDGPEPLFDWFNHMIVAHDGSLWAATNSGLYHIEGGKYKRWSMAEGLVSDRIHFVLEDPDGSIWAASPNGLIHIHEGRLTKIAVEDGLSDQRIYAIVADGLGYFWMSSGRGLLRVSHQSLLEFVERRTHRIECETFDSLDSIKFVDRTDQGYSGCKSLDGRIWFPSPRGVIVIDPAGFVINRVPPEVHLEKVEVNGHAVTVDRLRKLEVSDHNLEFFFSALSYISPKKIRVRYTLEGFDTGWVEAGSHRSVAYNNIREGEYTFRVQAANADGVWNLVGDQFKVILPLPFYERWWFFTLSAAAFLLSLYGAYQWKVRRMHVLQRKLQRSNELLETKVAQRTDELANSLSLLQATLDSTADGIIALEFSGKVVSYNRHFVKMWELGADFMQTATAATIRDYCASQVKDPNGFLTRFNQIHETTHEAFDVIELQKGRTFERYCRPQILKGQKVGIVINYRDITERRGAEKKLEDVHKELLYTSRQAGMAEVATSVLHNVGNVLNSVNVSATVVSDKIRDSKVNFVARVAGLLDKSPEELASFLTLDPKGRKIGPYLNSLSETLLTEQTELTEELGHLRKNIEHIKEVVAMQQNFGKVSGVTETIAVTELIEDALRINSAGLTRHAIEVVRDFQASPEACIDRHKAMQILVNILSNAKFACNASNRPDKKLIIRLTEAEGRFEVTVIDNGVGIPKENLTRIFAHGFTTKKEGHGFGLHSSALSAKELGGGLVALSDGLGHGATFILELPLNPPTNPAA